MFASSVDILNLVLSLCIVALTAFLCVALYYFASSMHKIHVVARKVENGVTKIEELIDMGRDKLRNSSAYLMILGEVAKKALEMIKEKRGAKKTAGRKK
jgi:hypothetical protein